MAPFDQVDPEVFNPPHPPNRLIVLQKKRRDAPLCIMWNINRPIPHHAQEAGKSTKERRSCPSSSRWMRPLARPQGGDKRVFDSGVPGASLRDRERGGEARGKRMRQRVSGKGKSVRHGDRWVVLLGDVLLPRGTMNVPQHAL